MKSKTNNLDGAAVAELVNAIEPILASQPAEIQGAALVNLLAIWLAGHVIPNDETGTDQLQDKLLAMHCSAVRILALIARDPGLRHGSHSSLHPHCTKPTP